MVLVRKWKRPVIPPSANQSLVVFSFWSHVCSPLFGNCLLLISTNYSMGSLFICISYRNRVLHLVTNLSPLRHFYVMNVQVPKCHTWISYFSISLFLYFSFFIILFPSPVPTACILFLFFFRLLAYFLTYLATLYIYRGSCEPTEYFNFSHIPSR